MTTPNNDENKDRRPTLEELFELKKAERPDEAFWDGFDKELKSKAIGTLVERRSRPTRLVNALRRSAGWAIPAFGCLALLFTVALRELNDGARNHGGPFATPSAETASAGGSLTSASPAEAVELAEAETDYVEDVIYLESERNLNYEKVMGGVVLKQSGRAVYVADSLKNPVMGKPANESRGRPDRGLNF